MPFIEKTNEQFLANIQEKITKLKNENDLLCNTLKDAGFDVFKPGDLQMIDYTVIKDEATAAYMAGNYEGQLSMYNKYLKDIADNAKVKRNLPYAGYAQANRSAVGALNNQNLSEQIDKLMGLS